MATVEWSQCVMASRHRLKGLRRSVRDAEIPPDHSRSATGSCRSSATSRSEGHFSYAEVSRSPVLLREPLAGTTVHTFPGTPGHLLASFSQFRSMTRPLGLGRGPDLISPYKRGVTGSNPVAPTKFSQLDGIFETLIGNPVTTAGNHRRLTRPRVRARRWHPAGGRGKRSRPRAAPADPA